MPSNLSDRWKTNASFHTPASLMTVQSKHCGKVTAERFSRLWVWRGISRTAIMNQNHFVDALTF